MSANRQKASGLLQSLTALVISATVWTACSNSVKEVPLRELKERQFSVRLQKAESGGFIVDLSLGYQQFPGKCLSIPSESIATFNGERLPIKITNGSGESCSWPQITRSFAALPEGKDATLTLTDGDLHIRMVAEDFLVPRRMAVQGGALVLGSDRNTLLMEPPQDSIYVFQSAFYPMVNDVTSGTPVLVNGAGDFRISDHHPQFSVPPTAPIGPGLLQVRSTIEAGHSLVCENADTCRATRDIETSAETTISHARIGGLYMGKIGSYENENCREDSCVEFYFYGQGTTMDVRPAPGHHSFAAPTTRVTTRWALGDQDPEYPQAILYDLYVPFNFKLMQATETELHYRSYSSHPDEFGCDYQLVVGNLELNAGFFATALTRCEDAAE